MTSWCILRCSGRSTLPLARSLAEDGFKVWTPVETLRPRGKRGKVRVPILPTFIFANSLSLWTLLALSEDPLCKHEGFSVMRHCGGLGYPTIADAELEPLRSEENRAVPAAERPIFAQNEPVHLPEGPFAGMSGIVESADHKHAWVRFMGFRRPVKIATFLLRPNGSNRLRSETDMAA